MTVSACGGGSQTSEQQSDSAEALEGLDVNQELHDRLPADVKESGTLTSVMPGAFPPYTIPAEGTQGFTGASIDMGDALGKVLGVEVETAPVEGLSGVLNGLASGRYNFAIGPIGDYPDRRDSHDFIDWVQEFVSFLVAEGNPEGVESINDTCGLRVAVQAGGSAEEVIRAQSKECTKNGKEAIEVQAFPDQPTSVLSVKSGRSDAFFSSQAPLTYFSSQNTGQLEVAAAGKSNDFGEIRQGAVFPKDSELRDVVLEGLEILKENGTYAEIMEEHGLEDQMLDKLTVNAGKAPA